MKKLLVTCFLIPLVISSAQNLDSLYNAFLAVKGVGQINVQQNVSIEREPIKCSFGIVNQAALNYDKFSPRQKAALSLLLQRPAADTSFVTPGGKFRIHYKKSGYDAPGYDLNELARAADSSYNYEVNFLGYPPPLKDFGKNNINGNPDDLYDIFIRNLSVGDYGYTQLDSSINNLTHTAYTVIDNDFGNGYNTHGIDGARVTVAHELHHAIQVGNYIYRESDNFYNEITSTAMENFVYPGINDYVYYIATYFRNTQRSFASYYDGGYSRAIWNIFLRDQFGKDIIKRIWELMPSRRALQAMSDAIQEKGSSLKAEYNTFGVWTYFTGERSISNKYFEDAAKYPLLSPMLLTNSMMVNSESLSNNFFQYNNFTSTNKDSVITLITNSDVEGAISSTNKILPFTYMLSSQQISGGKKIADGFYSKLETANSALLAESNVLTGYRLVEEIDYAYPQPFRYTLHNRLLIPAAGIKDDEADLSIFSVDMKLVYSGKRKVLTDQVISWGVLDQTGKKLGTGVYLYVTKSGDAIKKGKFVVYND